MHVLLATDGTEYAEEAAWLLSHLPHSETLELTILSVLRTPEFYGSAEVAEWLDRNAEAEKVQAVQACGRVEQLFLGADVRIESVVSEGHTGKTILQEARQRDVDLIVLGAVGHSPLDRMLLGSVSDFVATHALCSVLVVRPTGLRDQDHKGLSVCVAYDDSEPCKYAISRLGQFGWRGNTEFDVVSVAAIPLAYTEIPVEIDMAEVRAATEKTLEEPVAKLRELSPVVRSHVVESVHVGSGIVRFTDASETDLVLMGDTGRGLLGRFLLGSVSRYVLRHANCSVWIARDQAK